MTWITGDGKEIEVRDLEDSHLASILRMLKRQGSRHPLMPLLIAEAELRELIWDFGEVTVRGSLERAVTGAIRDCVNAHGPITKQMAPSAAKRVVGAIRDFNRRQRCSSSS